ncbi:MAG: tetratricopeptide repeat protein [Burkholderiales bacterium]
MAIPTSFDSATATFEQDVLEASRRVPVLVDFWAPWCGPCRALTPILEKVAAAAAGKFLLAKVDIDEHPELATRYGVRGIPNVKAFVDGQVVNEFTGALPESGVRRFLETVLPSPSEALRQGARSEVARGEFEAAEAKLHEAVALDADNHGARTDLAELLVARQEFAGAEAALAAVPAHRRDERAEKLAARVGVWKRGLGLPDAAALQARVAAHPDDLDARLAYAARLLADGDCHAGLEALLEVVRRDRGERRERARTAMVEAFRIAADQPDLVGEYRRKLASALY